MYKKIAIVFSVIFIIFASVGFTNNVQAAELIPLDAEVTPFADGGACDYTMTGWMYHSTVSSNVKVDKVVGAGASIIFSIYGPPWNKVKAAVQIANTAHLVVRDNVYYTEDYYRMFSNTGKSPLPVAAEKTITRFYSDSARTKIMDTKTQYNYSDWYCPG